MKYLDYLSLHDITAALKKRKKQVKLTFFVPIIIFLLIYPILPKTYRATAYVGTGSSLNSRAIFFDVGGMNYEKASLYMSYHRENLVSYILMQKVLDKLKADNYDIGDVDIYDFEKRVDSFKIYNSNLLRLHFKDSKPERAAYILNTIIDEYIKYRKQQVDDILQDEIKVVTEKYNLEKEKYVKKLHEIRDFKHTFNPDLYKIQFENNERTLHRVRGDLVVIDTQIKSMEDTVSYLSELEKKYGKSYVLYEKSSLREAGKMMGLSIQDRQVSADLALNNLRAQEKEYALMGKKLMRRSFVLTGIMNRKNTVLSELYAEIDRYESSFKNFQTKLNDLSLIATLPYKEVQVVSYAIPPEHPFFPNFLFLFPMVLVLSAIAAIFWPVFREYSRFSA